MSYEFEANPKVVQNRAKFKQNQTNTSHVSNDLNNLNILPNLMKDSRVKNMMPAQQEEEYVRQAKEMIKLQNMHDQLLTFKKNKKKVSPYEVRPTGNPKIEVNLEFFLTDSNNAKPLQTVVEIQTEKFQEKPSSPKYVPKKTGRDVHTQVEDDELFNFDREVQPIVEVVVTKLLEQAVIEIEEEEEIKKIQTFKQEFIKRRQQDEKAWKDILQKEVDKISRKNKILEKYREKEKNQIAVLQKIQSLKIGSEYLKNLSLNTVSFLYKSGYYQNNSNENIKVELPKHLIKIMTKKMETKESLLEQINTMFLDIPNQLMTLRAPRDQKIQKKREKRAIRRINYSNDNRLMRIYFNNPQTPASNLAYYLPKWMDNTLEEYLNNTKAKIQEIYNKLENSEINAEDTIALRAQEFPEYLANPTHFRIALADIDSLGFSLSHNPLYETDQKNYKFGLTAFAFDKDGNFLFKINKDFPKNSNKSIRYKKTLRDKTIRMSDDFGIVINYKSLPKEVHHILLTVNIDNLAIASAAIAELPALRYRLTDHLTDQCFDYVEIAKTFRIDELKDPNLDAEAIQSAYLINYYLYRNNVDSGWMIESLKGSKNISGENYQNVHSILEKLIQQIQENLFKSLEELVDVLKSNIKSDRKKQPPDTKKDPKKADSSFQRSSSPGKLDQSLQDVKKLASSRTFGPIAIKITDDLDNIVMVIEDLIKKQSMETYTSFENGYQIFTKDKPLSKTKNIFKLNNMQDFQIKANPKPEPVVIDENDPNLVKDQIENAGNSDNDNQNKEKKRQSNFRTIKNDVDYIQNTYDL